MKREINEETINILIDKIREIDKCLDAYDYMNCTYEEYLECIRQNKTGNMSLRHRIISGHHIWDNHMEDTLYKTKQLTNLLYKKSYNKINTDDVIKLIGNLALSRDNFYKKTDSLSIYPIQSITIRDNLNTIIEILSRYDKQ